MNTPDHITGIQPREAAEKVIYRKLLELAAELGIVTGERIDTSGDANAIVDRLIQAVERFKQRERDERISGILGSVSQGILQTEDRPLDPRQLHNPPLPDIR